MKITLQDIRNSWRDIITRLEQSNSKIAHFLEDVRLHSFDGKQVLVELVNGHRFHLKTLEKDAKLVEEEMYDILGKSIKIKFILQDDLDKLKERMTKLIDKVHHCVWEDEYDKYLTAVGYFLDHWDDIPDHIRKDVHPKLEQLGI